MSVAEALGNKSGDGVEVKLCARTMSDGTTPTSVIQRLLPAASFGVAALLEVVNPWSLLPLGGASLGQGSGLGRGEGGTQREGLVVLGTPGQTLNLPGTSTRVKAKGTSIEPIHHIR